MKKSMTKTLLATLSLTSTLAVPSISSMAATTRTTTFKYYPTTMSMNGTKVESSSRIVARDPISGVMTSFVPTWYLQQLHKHDDHC